MKKKLCAALSLCLCAALTACAGSAAGGGNEQNESAGNHSLVFHWSRVLLGRGAREKPGPFTRRKAEPAAQRGRSGFGIYPAPGHTGDGP